MQVGKFSMGLDCTDALSRVPSFCASFAMWWLCGTSDRAVNVCDVPGRAVPIQPVCA